MLDVMPIINEIGACISELDVLMLQMFGEPRPDPAAFAAMKARFEALDVKARELIAAVRDCETSLTVH